MYRRTFSTSLLFAAGALVVGCGGGGSSTITTPVGGTGITQTVGPISITAASAKAIKPLSVGSGSVLVYTLSGTTFTNVSYTPAHTINNSRIAYAGADSQIYSVAPDGSGLSQVTGTAGRGYLTDMSWSPGASALAYLGDVGGGYTYFKIGADGSGQTQLANFDPSDFSVPQWSPGGSTYAYSTYDLGTAHYQVFISGFNSNPPTRISDGSSDDTKPAWNSTGTMLAFLRGNDVYTMNADGSNVTRVSNIGTCQSVQWSPDGSRFICATYDGTNHRLQILYPNGDNSFPFISGYQLSPCFSPDGKQIAFVSVDTSNNYSVCTATPSGGNVQTIAYGGTYVSWSSYLGKRLFIGTGGSFASSASGFLFSQVGDSVNSFVSYSAVTPSTATVTNVAIGGSNIGFQISGGGGITSLRYANNVVSAPTVAIPSGSTTSVPGVFVSMSNEDGHVSLTAPYVEAKRVQQSAATVKFEGKFTALYDGNGKNLAPNGASSIEVAPKTGKLLSFRP